MNRIAHKYFLHLSLLLLMSTSCKKERIEPLMVDKQDVLKYIHPIKVEILDSINNCSATVYIEYTFDKKVKKIRREVLTPNADLDSTFEINYTYQGQNVIKMTRSVEFLSNPKPSKYTEVNYQYNEGRIYTAQRITSNNTQGLDTTSWNYFVLKKSDGLDYLNHVRSSDDFLQIYKNVPLEPISNAETKWIYAYMRYCENCGYNKSELSSMHEAYTDRDYSELYIRFHEDYSYLNNYYLIQNFKLRSNKLLKIQNSIFESISFIAYSGYSSHEIHDIVYFQDLYIDVPVSISLLDRQRNQSGIISTNYLSEIELNTNSNGQLISAELKKHLNEYDMPKDLVERRSYKFYY